MAADSTPADASSGGRFEIDFCGARLLGTYLVRERLASGGMGSVYLAQDENLHRAVVVKVPHARLLGEPGFAERFAREITELVRLEHPHIVRILAQGVHDDVPFFVLQYLAGPSLGKHLDAAPGGRQSAADLTDWLPTVARTLDFIHARGTVHRDVKPDNILFDEAGNVFLSDFGVAKAMGPGTLDLTDIGTGIGSPQYMSPEQALGKAVTGRADQYALATTVFRALTGRLPFEGDTLVELLVQKHTKEVTPFEDPEHVPPALWPVLLRALARDPAARFPTCAAFADAAREALAPPAAEPPPQAATRPAPHALLAAGVLVVLAAVLWVWAPWSSGSGSVQAQQPTAPEERSTLVVMDAGAEPRTLLVYAPPVGLKQDWVYDADQQLQLPPDAPSGAMGGMPLTLGLRMRGTFQVLAADPDGTLHCTFRQVRVEARSKHPMVAALLDRQQSAPGVRELLGKDWAFRLSRHGEVTLPPDAVEALGEVSPTLMASIRSVLPQLPDVPVGAGARWVVSSAMNLGGTPVRFASTHRVDGVDGQRVRLYVEFGGQRDAAVTNGGDGAMMSGRIGGRGTMTLDLNHLAPVELDSTLEQESTVKQPDGTEMTIRSSFHQWTPPPDPE